MHRTHIAKDIEIKDYGQIVKGQDLHQIELLRRKEADLRILYGASEDKFPTTADLHMQTKKILKELESHVAQERGQESQMEISL